MIAGALLLSLSVGIAYAVFQWGDPRKSLAGAAAPHATRPGDPA
jgi:hypothetical protein